MNTERPKVSIVTPTYNCADLLDRAIRSVLNQTFSNFELIVVDDGSTDHTEEVVKQFRCGDDRIRYFYQENSGSPAHPTNKGIRESTGKFIAILQHDDEWLPEKLEKQIVLFEAKNNKKLGFVGCHALMIQQNRGSQVHKLKKRENIRKDLLVKNVIPYPSAILIKKEALDKTGKFDENFRVVDDWDMWLRMSLHYEFDFVDDILVKYYVHGGNITQKTGHMKKAKEIEYFVKKHISLYKVHPKILEKKYITIGSEYILDEELKKGQLYVKKAFVTNKTLKNALWLLIAHMGRKIYYLYYYIRGYVRK